MNEPNKPYQFVLTVSGVQEAEKAYPYPLELIGPFLQSIHYNDPESFYDAVILDMPDEEDLQESNIVSYASISNYHQSHFHNQCIDIFCTLADEAMEKMRPSLLTTYQQTNLQQMLNTHCVSEVKMLDAHSVAVRLDPILP